ncbi:MAG: hypothetical protein ACWA40_03555 [Planktomarina sp.]
MNHCQIETMFTPADGTYSFARWGRPMAPIVFGVEDQTLEVVKSAIEAVCAATGHKMMETDPELGSNFMFFFFRDWAELLDVPDLDHMIPDFKALVARLQSRGANQYRLFRFDEKGAIKACFVFLCMDKALMKVSADALALGQVVQSFLLWSNQAFADQSPLAVTDTGTTIIHPDVMDLMRVAYDPILPDAANDPSHALRMAARLGGV